MAFFSEAIGVAGLIIQAVALVVLARGSLRRFFPLFLYLVTSLTASLVEGWVLRSSGNRSSLYYFVYYGSELILDILLLLLVVDLSIRVLDQNPFRSKVVRYFLFVGGAAIAVLLFVYGRPTLEPAVIERWNLNVAQLLNFTAALLLLGMWTAMLLSRQRDRQLVLVSTGLGLTLAAAALTLGVRQFTHQGDLLRTLIDMFHRLTQIASPAIWCWAFWPMRSGSRRPVEPAPHTV